MTFTKALGYLLDLVAFVVVAQLAQAAGFGVFASVGIAIGVDLAFQTGKQLIRG